MDDKKDFDAAFKRVVSRMLIAAGVGTGAGISIYGGCVPADCGDFKNSPTYLQSSPELEQEVLDALTAFSADNPDATSVAKLTHLYGSSMATGLFRSDSQLTQVGLTLLEEVASESGGTLAVTTCQQFCNQGGGVSSCKISRDEVTQDAALLCTGTDKSGCIGGREPAGLQSTGVVAGEDARGVYWAYLCHLEACAVHAFAALHEELVFHDAPASLQRAALKAMQEEIVHVRLTGRLAQRFGVTPQVAVVDRPAPRPIFELALDNAAEGCIREAFGALEMQIQSTMVADPEIAAVLAQIALDETDHARLSWQIDAWAQARLTAAQRNAVAAARRDAVARLRAEVATRSPEQTRALTIPTAAQANAILDVLEEELMLV